MAITIHLVEDDVSIRSLLKTLLEIEGFAVTEAGLGSDSSLAAEIIQNLPDAVVMDVFLKDASGLDVLRKLRAHAATQTIPVMITSGMDLQRECKTAGASAFLMKPYMPDDLIDWLKSVQKDPQDHLL